jgi:hypothetical protein
VEDISINGVGRPYDQEMLLTEAELEHGRVFAEAALAKGEYEDFFSTNLALRNRHLRRRYPRQTSPFNKLAGLIAWADSDGGVTRLEKQVTKQVMGFIALQGLRSQG